MPIGTQKEGQNCYDRAGHDLIIGTFQSAEAASLSYLIDQITRLQAKIGSQHEPYTFEQTNFFGSCEFSIFELALFNRKHLTGFLDFNNLLYLIIFQLINHGVFMLQIQA